MSQNPTDEQIVDEGIKAISNCSTTNNQQNVKTSDEYSAEKIKKLIKKKLKELDDFGIETKSIPNGYFRGVRSQREIEVRAINLIKKKLASIS